VVPKYNHEFPDTADSEEEEDVEELEESEEEEIFQTPTRRATPRPPKTSSRERVLEYLTRKNNPSTKSPTARSTINSKKNKLTYEEEDDERARPPAQDPKIAILEAQISQFAHGELDILVALPRINHEPRKRREHRGSRRRPQHRVSER